MKLLLTSLLFCSVAHAGERLPTDMYCDDTKKIVKSLREEYKEAPFMIGKAGDVAGSVMTFWINPETKSWSIVATKDNTSCIVGVGESIELISYDKKAKTIKYY
jgi:hypothetical protein